MNPYAKLTHNERAYLREREAAESAHPYGDGKYGHGYDMTQHGEGKPYSGEKYDVANAR